MTKLLTLLGVVGMAIAATAQTAQFPNINVRTNASVGTLTNTTGQAITTTGFTMPSTGVLGGTSGGAVGVFNFPTDPATITQSGTNVVVDLSTYSLQTLTATNDLYITATNLVAGANVLLEILSGDTNRTLAFDSNYVWMCPKPTIISSNHLMWITILPWGTQSTNVRMSAVQSYP